MAESGRVDGALDLYVGAREYLRCAASHCCSLGVSAPVGRGGNGGDVGSGVSVRMEESDGRTREDAATLRATAPYREGWLGDGRSV